jgi:hypothetical protein
MSTDWPEFANEKLDDGRRWSATFDSYDQRKDTVYYVVTLSDGTSFMVAVSALLSTEQWNDEEARTTLGARLGRVAATGQTNTSYRGPVMRM